MMQSESLHIVHRRARSEVIGREKTGDAPLRHRPESSLSMKEE